LPNLWIKFVSFDLDSLIIYVEHSWMALCHNRTARLTLQKYEHCTKLWLTRYRWRIPRKTRISTWLPVQTTFDHDVYSKWPF
jgi:hypothetical protein